jgi:hypothetical protein
LGNFAVNIMSVLYFIQVFVDDSSSVAFWIVSLISSTGFALAMDKVCPFKILIALYVASVVLLYFCSVLMRNWFAVSLLPIC